MARITVEDCLNNVNNRFTLIHMVAKRVRQLRKGSEPTIVSKNRDIVLSLREIASGNITKRAEEAMLLSENQTDLLSGEISGENSGTKSETSEKSKVE